MKDALGHGSNAGWGAHPQTGQLKTAAKYQSLNGRKDAVVRTEKMPAGYLWQHGNQYGHANSVADAKATVESRVADEARYNTHDPVNVTSAFDGPREKSGLGAKSYGVKRDYPKQDVYVNGKYHSTTTWSRTGKEAADVVSAKFGHPRSSVTARKQSK